MIPLESGLWNASPAFDAGEPMGTFLRGVCESVRLRCLDGQHLPNGRGGLMGHPGRAV